MGIVPSPFDCAMVNRSLKTLELRMQQHMKNCLAVTKFLESHPCVEQVLHPCTYTIFYLYLAIYVLKIEVYLLSIVYLNYLYDKFSINQCNENKIHVLYYRPAITSTT